MNQVDPDALVRAVSIVYVLPQTSNIGSVYVGVESRLRHGGAQLVLRGSRIVVGWIYSRPGSLR